MAFASASFASSMRPLYTFDIGGEDRRELADRLYFLAHCADKANPFAVRRANEALLLAVVPERVARRIDPRAQCRLRNDALVPYRGIAPTMTAAKRSALAGAAPRCATPPHLPVSAAVTSVPRRPWL
jgi:hypothetical protein